MIKLMAVAMVAWFVAMLHAGTLDPSPSPSPTPTPIVVVVTAGPVNVTSPVTVRIPDDTGLLWATYLAALAGLLTALSALAISLDWPSRWLRGPVLEVSLRQESPDCHLIMAKTESRNGEEEEIPTYYCRLRVANRQSGWFGRLEARSVEVQLLRLWRLSNDGVEELDPVFLPIRLQWAHSGDAVLSTILPGLYHHCDLLRIMPGTKDRNWMEFTTEVQPNRFPSGEMPTVKEPGKYIVDLAIAASNAATVSHRVRIEWDGTLGSDDERMHAGFRIALDPSPAKRSTTSHRTTGVTNAARG
jgi:hypothetical protein